jgi:uncharacterized protein (DUF2249 family)
MVLPEAVDSKVPAALPGSTPAPAHGVAGEQPGSAGEHAVLLHEVRKRDQAIRAVLVAGRWPAREPEALVDYLRYEVLDQAVSTQRLLFPSREGFLADARIHRLVDDHVRLRNVTEQLTTAEGARPEPGALVETLDTLVAFLDRHMREEGAALSATSAAGVESLRQPFRCHLWFPMTEGFLLDLDVLPHEFAQRAVVERFLRLRPGEQIVVRSRRELGGLWSALTSRLPGEIGWVYLEEGPERWQAEVTRRAPE